MKTLLVITFVDFWRQGSGHRARVSSFISFLQTKTSITVFFAGVVTETDRLILRNDFPEILLKSAGSDGVLTFKEYSERFRAFIQNRSFDFVLVEYIELSGILKYLPPETVTLLDTHDLVFDKIKSFKKMSVKYDGLRLTRQEEMDIFLCYDYIILIQENDRETVSKWIDKRRLILASHPVAATKLKIRKQVQSVGYVASSYSPNIEALQWFLNTVWGHIHQKHGLILNIYGNIKNAFSHTYNTNEQNVVFHGFTNNLVTAYRTSDIIINPVRCGAGLKIKNVEALGHGLPLVTTSHGIYGMENAFPDCLLKADDALEFQSAFNLLVDNYPFRKKLAEKAFDYARANFSSEYCYKEVSPLFT